MDGFSRCRADEVPEPRGVIDCTQKRGRFGQSLERRCPKLAFPLDQGHGHVKIMRVSSRELGDKIYIFFDVAYSPPSYSENSPTA